MDKQKLVLIIALIVRTIYNKAINRNQPKKWIMNQQMQDLAITAAQGDTNAQPSMKADDLIDLLTETSFTEKRMPTMTKQVSDCHLELCAGEFDNAPAHRLKDESVVMEFCRYNLDGYDPDYTPWPGTHKNVHYWVVTENRNAIGMNENPAMGLSFPVIKLNPKRYRELLAQYGQLPLIP